MTTSRNPLNLLSKIACTSQELNLVFLTLYIIKNIENERNRGNRLYFNAKHALDLCKISNLSSLIKGFKVASKKIEIKNQETILIDSITYTDGTIIIDLNNQAFKYFNSYSKEFKLHEILFILRLKGYNVKSLAELLITHEDKKNTFIFDYLESTNTYINNYKDLSSLIKSNILNPLKKLTMLKKIICLKKDGISYNEASIFIITSESENILYHNFLTTNYDIMMKDLMDSHDRIDIELRLEKYS